MTTDKQIQEAANDYSQTLDFMSMTYLSRSKAFEDGAKWMQSQSQWVPVTERLPEDYFDEFGLIYGNDILMCTPNGKLFKGKRVFDAYENKFMWIEDSGAVLLHVEYWQKCTKPPKAEQP